IGVFKVIGGKCGVLCGKGGAAAVGELIGVQFELEASSFCRGKEALGLFGRECNAFAKRIDGVGKVFSRNGAQQGTANEIDGRATILRLLGGQSMQAEKRAPN